MFISAHVLLSGSLFIHGVSSTPFPPPTGSFRAIRAGHSIPIARRSFRQKAPTHDNGSIRVFDSSFAQKELRGVLAKYEQASEFIQGVGLAPEQDFTAYFPIISNAESKSIFDNGSSTLTYNTADTPLIPPVFVATGTGIMPMVDAMSGTLDVLYYGPLEFGTPAQKLTVDVDTGSADLWVPVDCPKSNCKNKQFDSGTSSTYRNHATKFSVTYGSGAVHGKLVTDVVSMAGLTVEGQAFGAVSSESDDFNEYPNDGLLGMAFGTIAQSRKPTFFENLIREKKLAAPLFSVHLARNQEVGSEVCFGCYDSTKTLGTVSWVPVTSKTYWSVSMDSLVINSARSFPINVIAAIDTGTTLIYFPDDVAAKFYGMIPGAKPATQYGPGFYTYPCAATLDIAFSFSNRLFSLNIFDFNMGRTGVNSLDCVGGILSLGNGFPPDLAIIGDEFLKSWYSTFDYSNGARVGFSPSVNNKN